MPSRVFGKASRLTSMSANVEDGIKFLGAADKARQLLGILPQRLFVVQEMHRCFVVLCGLDRARVKRSLSTSWTGNGDLGMGCKNVIGMGELWLFRR